MKGLKMNFINLLLKNKYYQQIPRFCRFYNWVLKIKKKMLQRLPFQ